MSVAVSLRFSWFYGPFVGGGGIGEGARSTERNLLMANLSAGRNGNVIRLFGTDRWKLINISSAGIWCNFSCGIRGYSRFRFLYHLRYFSIFLFIVIFIYFIYSSNLEYYLPGFVVFLIYWYFDERNMDGLLKYILINMDKEKDTGEEFLSNNNEFLINTLKKKRKEKMLNE